MNVNKGNGRIWKVDPSHLPPMINSQLLIQVLPFMGVCGEEGHRILTENKRGQAFDNPRCWACRVLGFSSEPRMRGLLPECFSAQARCKLWFPGHRKPRFTVSVPWYTLGKPRCKTANSGRRNRQTLRLLIFSER